MKVMKQRARTMIKWARARMDTWTFFRDNVDEDRWRKKRNMNGR